MNQTYELQCARAERNEWRKTAVRMYELICEDEIEQAVKIFEHHAYKFTQEDR